MTFPELVLASTFYAGSTPISDFTPISSAALPVTSPGTTSKLGGSFYKEEWGLGTSNFTILETQRLMYVRIMLWNRKCS